MDYQLLGKSGITVSAIGIGTGGPSRVGLRTGSDEAAARDLIATGFDHGVNFIDTAEAYGTENVVGTAIAGLPRGELVLSTKISQWESLSSRSVVDAVHVRLTALRTDYLDICHFHAVPVDRYDWLCENLVPALVKCKEQGSIRALGITEAFNPDPSHRTLTRAVDDPFWDVMMVGYNILNQSAASLVFPSARASGVGVLGMFAVRLALTKPERLRQVVLELCDTNRVSLEELEEAGGTTEDPLGWVVRDSDARTLTEAAYRFVRHEEAVHVTLTGTGNPDHLLENIDAVQKPPLNETVVRKLRHLFRNVDGISGQ